MPQYVAEDHFVSGVWAADGPLRLRSYTCLTCGHRLTTWEAFRTHRRSCAGAGATHPGTTPVRFPTEQEPAARVAMSEAA